jgi:hypothetical protein
MERLRQPVATSGQRAEQTREGRSGYSSGGTYFGVSRGRGHPESLLLVHGAGSGPWIFDAWLESFAAVVQIGARPAADLRYRHELRRGDKMWQRPSGDDTKGAGVVLTEEMKKFVLEQRLAYHATVNPDSTPNLSHKGTTSVYDDERLFFADIRSPQTVANLRANPAIEVNVVDIFSRRGYRFRGMATVHERGDDVYNRGLELLRERDYDAYEDRVRSIVLIRVESAEHMTSPAYDVGQTEDELVEHYIEYYVRLHRGSHGSS